MLWPISSRYTAHRAWLVLRRFPEGISQQGPSVATPTHAGVGERVHQATQAFTLETRLRDVACCIEAQERKQVILCEHSYGAMVIAAATDRMPERVRAQVYLDAFVPENGGLLNALIQDAGACRGAAVSRRFSQQCKANSA